VAVNEQHRNAVLQRRHDINACRNLDRTSAAATNRENLHPCAQHLRRCERRDDSIRYSTAVEPHALHMDGGARCTQTCQLHEQRHRCCNMPAVHSCNAAAPTRSGHADAAAPSNRGMMEQSMGRGLLSALHVGWVATRKARKPAVERCRLLYSQCTAA
jgi:hypothetical protein